MLLKAILTAVGSREGVSDGTGNQQNQPQPAQEEQKAAATGTTMTSTPAQNPVAFPVLPA